MIGKGSLNREKQAYETPLLWYEALVVGETRFELATLWSQTRCATRLRYSPKGSDIIKKTFKSNLVLSLPMPFMSWYEEILSPFEKP